MQLLAPIAPHWAEELWHKALGETTFVHEQSWPTFDPEKAKADTVELAVQLNGKIKAKIVVSADAANDTIEADALGALAADLDGKEVKKVVVVPGRLVNVVAR